MTSSQVNKKIFDNESIKIEITNASPIYLPILEQELGFSFVFFYIYVEILNQTNSTIYLDPHYTFLSEVHSSKNEDIKRISMIFNANKIEKEQNKLSLLEEKIFFKISSIFKKNKIEKMLKPIDYDIFNYTKILPKGSQSMMFGLRPLFRENIFSLSLPTTSEYFPSLQYLRQFCVFENLEAGEYDMKLVYTPTQSQELEKLKEKNSNLIDSEQYIESSSIKLNLILPIKEEPNILTTPKIKFQIFIAEKNDIKLSEITKKMNLWECLSSRILRSSSHPKPYIFLPLCFRVINRSLRPYRFDFYSFTPPNFIYYDGTLIDWEVVASPFKILYGKSEDYPIVMPNKSIDFYPNLVIFLSGWNQFRLSLFSRNKCHLISESLKFGKYHVCFNYQNRRKKTYADDAETQETPQLKDFWIGSISTPFIDINLSPP